MFKLHLNLHNGVYAAWGAFLSFTQDIHSAFFGLMFCILIDTITGFWAAPYRGQLRKSTKLKAIVNKTITYATAIITLHVLEKLIFPDYGTALELQLARCGCTLFAGIEFYSIMENLGDITGLKIFKILTQFTLKKIEEKTGIEVKNIKN